MADYGSLVVGTLSITALMANEQTSEFSLITYIMNLVMNGYAPKTNLKGWSTSTMSHTQIERYNSVPVITVNLEHLSTVIAVRRWVVVRCVG